MGSARTPLCSIQSNISSSLSLFLPEASAMDCRPDSTLHTPVTSVHLLQPPGALSPPSDDVGLPTRNQCTPSSTAYNLSNSTNTVVCHIEDTSSSPETAFAEARASKPLLENTSPSSLVQVPIGGASSGNGSDIISGDVPALSGSDKGIVGALPAVTSDTASGGGGGSSTGCGGGGAGSGGGAEDCGEVAVVGEKEKRHSRQLAASTESASRESPVPKRARHQAKKVSDKWSTCLME